MTFSIRSHFAFQGPNVWNNSPVTHALVDAQFPESMPLGRLRLERSYAGLAELAHEGTPLEPIVGEVQAELGATLALMALNLQRVAGIPVGFHAGRPRPTDSGYDVVVQHCHAPVGLMAARIALRWLCHLMAENDPAFDLARAFTQFLGFQETCDGGVMGRALTAAAVQRGIPLSNVDPRGRILEFGDGCYRQRMMGRMTMRTPAIAVQIAHDKFLTNTYLHAAGFPVPKSIAVRTLPQALAAARTIGYPVVVKPAGLGDSIGVSLDLRSDDDVRACFDDVSRVVAAKDGQIVIERFIQGNHYRVLVVNDAIVAAAQRIFPQVTGDGVHTILQLIDIENTTARRDASASNVYKKIAVDKRIAETLERDGMSLHEVPLPGREIVLNLSSNRQDGVMQMDVTDAIHPANATFLRAAVKLVGLDIAGIDLVLPDISQPIWDTGGAIIEINEDSAFNLHLFPEAGPAHDPGPAIMEMLFPSDQPVRVPVVAVSADATSASICTLIASAASTDRRSVGMATRDGVVIDGLLYRGVDGRNLTGPRTILNNPDVELAIVEVDSESIVTHGLGFDRCDIAVILSLSGEQTPFGEPVEVVLLRALDDHGRALLNGRDPGIRALSGALAGTIDIIWIDAGETQMGDSTLISQAVVAATECLHLTDAR